MFNQTIYNKRICRMHTFNNHWNCFSTKVMEYSSNEEKKVTFTRKECTKYSAHDAHLNILHLDIIENAIPIKSKIHKRHNVHLVITLNYEVDGIHIRNI